MKLKRLGLVVSVISALGIVHANASDTSEASALEVMDAFMTAFNGRDLDAWEATFHFPHVRIASGQATILPAGGERSPQVFDQLASTGWHHSGWDFINVIYAGDEKVHLDVQFTRYREDDTVLATYRSLYIVTLQDGHWGIKARSSFAP